MILVIVVWLYLLVFQWQEELCSDSVERIVVNPNAAYDKFKDKHVTTKGLGQFIVDDKSFSTSLFIEHIHLTEGYTEGHHYCQ